MRTLTLLFFLFIAIPAQAAPVSDWATIRFTGVVDQPGTYFGSLTTFEGFLRYDPEGAAYNYRYIFPLRQVFWYGGVGPFVINPEYAPVSNLAMGPDGFSMFGEAGGHDNLSLAASFDGTGEFTLSGVYLGSTAAHGFITGVTQVPEPASWILIPFAVIWIAISKRRLFT